MQFKVKALRRPEGVVEAIFDAPTAADAERQAEAQGLRVISVARSGGLPAVGGGRRSRFPLVLFSQELHTLLRAGLSLVDSIESLAEK
ncbi:MAG: type II secretion system F family protein, partial [Rhodocyclaceae bacterium]